MRSQSSAAFGLEAIHADKAILESIVAWEVAQLRRALKLRPKGADDLFAYRERSKTYIKMLFQKLGRKMLHHRILAAMFDLAGSATAPSVQIVGDRGAMWWEFFRSVPYHQRRKLGAVHSHSGRRAAWEDLLVKFIGIDWEAKLQKISVPDRIDKKRDFIDATCADLGLPIEGLRS